MWSNVGVMYRIKLIRKNGTCRTEFATKSSPLAIVSSHVTVSKLIVKERSHRVSLARTILEGDVNGFLDEIGMSVLPALISRHESGCLRPRLWQLVGNAHI